MPKVTVHTTSGQKFSSIITDSDVELYVNKFYNNPDSVAAIRMATSNSVLIIRGSHIVAIEVKDL